MFLSLVGTHEMNCCTISCEKLLLFICDSPCSFHFNIFLHVPFVVFDYVFFLALLPLLLRLYLDIETTEEQRENTSCGWIGINAPICGRNIIYAKQESGDRMHMHRLRFFLLLHFLFSNWIAHFHIRQEYFMLFLFFLFFSLFCFCFFFVLVFAEADGKSEQIYMEKDRSVRLICKFIPI